MDELLNKFRKYSRQFICWWITTIVSIFIPLIGMLAGVTLAKLKCRSCGKKFEYRSDGR